MSDLDAPFDETAGQRLKRLVAHWQATKDQATASELFRLLSPRMYAQAWHMHPDAHMRQEFVAEAFMRTLKRYRATSPASVPTWAHRMLKDVKAEFYRRGRSNSLGLTNVPTETVEVEWGDNPVTERFVATPRGEFKDEPEEQDLEALIERRAKIVRLAKAVPTVRQRIEDAGYERDKEIGMLAALDSIFLRIADPEAKETDSKLARRIGTSPKQAGRYVAYVRTMLHEELGTEEGQL